ncbi:MAG: hypothetical protein ETSY1_13750 [Candidatus Entotheonella factor]|uniref:HPr kinase/phosphorylase C-terminal domain-containing protein n=1 Tax=Entotheonella factor TaxID=1429438 RepID=W4LPD2_ENTF1|nr:MAG: hypothetical protein ETSY1_13750 [Candidatus Entotheonella factor]
MHQKVLYQAKPGEFLLQLHDIAHFWVREGKTITVERSPQATDADVQVFLLGSAFGALLHQRGVLPLHGSAVVTPEGVVVFVGHSGNGKSTLAGAFAKRGYAVLSDDVCAVTIASGVPLASPGVPWMRLWADMQRHLDGAIERRRVREGQEKYIVPLDGQFARKSMPLRAVVELTVGSTDELWVKPLADMSKSQVLLRHTYRSRFVGGLGLEGSHFMQVMQVANQIEVYRLCRPQVPFRLAEMVELIESEVMSAATERASA